jgi:uncharacterized LabA/DUF88 family protein
VSEDCGIRYVWFTVSYRNWYALKGENQMSNAVGVFVELANVNGGMDVIKRGRGLKQSCRLDLEKLISAITLGSEIVCKIIYTEKRNGGDTEAARKTRKFHDYLKHAGFTVVTKDCKIITTDTGDKVKANFDVEIAVDICRCIWRRDCKEIILISGDSDFAYLIDEANKYDIKTTVVSTRGTISKELTERAHRLILLDDLDLNTITSEKEKK